MQGWETIHPLLQWVIQILGSVLGTIIDTYLQLNPMLEAKAIKFTTLHLEGEAYEWWYHVLVTLGHSNITSYLDITQRLIDQFDKKDFLQGANIAQLD